MNAIYETDFRGFSYGFRPGRRQHQALDALAEGLSIKKVNWVLDADIRGYFDAISHDWLMRFVEHRIADRRVLRLVKKWLNAGVLEDGQVTRVEEGAPQGASASPLLANLYLHYVLDLWIQQWRRKTARGDVIVVRWADDFIVGFQYEEEAVRFLNELRTRFAKFDLELHPEKTRLIEFGRFAVERRKRCGRSKPETFDFLGFTHIAGKTRNGKFVVIRRTAKTRFRRKLRELKEQLRRAINDPIPQVGRWLGSVLRGHYQYFAVPRNCALLDAFRWQLSRLWWKTLKRRSHRAHVSADRIKRLTDRWLPRPANPSPLPLREVRRSTLGRSRMR